MSYRVKFSFTQSDPRVDKFLQACDLGVKYVGVKKQISSTVDYPPDTKQMLKLAEAMNTIDGVNNCKFDGVEAL